MTATALLKHIIAECDRWGVELRLINAKLITQSGAACGGLFSPSERVLAVAVDDENWIPFMCHEFSHMLQASEDQFNMSLDPTKQEKLNKIEDPNDLFDSWLYGGKEVAQKRLHKATVELIACELDACRRACDLLSWYGVYSAERYTQQSNAHLYAYGFALKHRKWAHPKLNPALQKALPDHFLLDPIQYLSVPKAVERIYLRELK